MRNRISTAALPATRGLAAVAVKAGIDVSKWQGEINWPKVKAAGIDFAMIKAANGSNRGLYTIDSRFDQNIKGAVAAGIDAGVYMYSYALSVNAALGEAEYLIWLLEPYRKWITYPVAFDLEDDTQRNLGRTTLSAMARAFCDRVRAAGYVPMLYSNVDWLTNRVDIPAGVDLWLAQWGVSAPSPKWPCTIWQKSDKGSVSGITGPVDMNVGYKDYAAAPELPVADEKRYQFVAELPDWARPVIEKAIAQGILRGSSAGGNADGNLDLSHDMVRMFVFLERAGVFDNGDE